MVSLAELDSIEHAELARMDPARFQRRYRNRAVVIRGLARRWEIFEAWHPQRLRERIGHTRVVYHYRPRAPGAELRHRESSFAEFLTLASRRPHPLLGPAYLDEWTLLWDHPELEAPLHRDVDGLFDDWLAHAPMIWDLAQRQRTSVWLGQDGSSTPLHVDSHSALTFLALLHGRKELMCLSGQDLGLHYYRTIGRLLERGDTFLEPSVASVEDLARALGVALPTVFHATLEAGDVLHLPSRWFHQIRNRGLSLSVSRYYYQGSNLRRSVAHMARTEGPRAALVYALMLAAGGLAPRAMPRLDAAQARRVEALLDRITGRGRPPHHFVDRLLLRALFTGSGRPFAV